MQTNDKDDDGVSTSNPNIHASTGHHVLRHPRASLHAPCWEGDGTLFVAKTYGAAQCDVRRKVHTNLTVKNHK